MMLVFQKKLFPDTLGDCHVYGGKEDCFHLFFKCQFSKAILSAQRIPWADISSEEAFLEIPKGWSFQDGGKVGKALCSYGGNLAALG